MHFRHILISGLLAGAALFLPDNALAEKNELSGQQNSVKANVHAEQTEIEEKQVNVPKNEKSTAIPEPASKAQSGVKPEASNRVPEQAASKKTAAVSKELPDQAKSDGQAAIKKAEKAVKAPSQVKSAAVQAIGKNKPTHHDGPENSMKIVVKTKADSPGLMKPKEGKTHLSVPKQADSFEPSVSGTPKKVPTDKEKIPTANQVPNPAQRSSSSGGQSHDRMSHGFTTLGLWDKWFEWNHHYEISFVQPYLSRYALLNNQWVNAPPAPPPQGAPLLETVYRS